MTTASESNVESVVHNLRTHVGSFRSFIFKEVAEIAVDARSGHRLEYRAIGLAGRFLMFDRDRRSENGPPDPNALGLRPFAEAAFSILAAGGADGSLFVDVALTTDKPIVVECKNLMNGTIKSVQQFGEALLRLGSA